MTAETSAQLHVALYVLGGQHGTGEDTPISMVFDNQIAAKFAMAVAAAGKHKHLRAAVGALWQMVSAGRPTAWGHVYSHMGNPMIEFADTVVECMAWRVDMRSTQLCPCSIWAREYEIDQVKLLYLLCVPPNLRHAYAQVNADNTAVKASIRRRCKGAWRQIGPHAWSRYHPTTRARYAWKEPWRTCTPSVHSMD